MPVFDESGWTKHALVTVDNSAAGSSSLSHFQADILLEGECYADWQLHGKPDGSDLRVVDEDGMLLSHWLEDDDGSRLSIKAKVPSVASGSKRTPRVHYGNPSASNVSDAAKTIGPSTPIIGPDDIIDQTDIVGYNDGSWLECLRFQGGPDGGGINGRILCVATVGSSAQPSGNGRIGMKHSDDGGKTWSQLEFISGPPVPMHGFSCQFLRELASGKLLLCYSYDLNSRLQTATQAWYVASSVDGGSTWKNLGSSPTNPLAVPWVLGIDKGIAYGAFLEVEPGGDILKLCYQKHTANGGGTVSILRLPAGSDPTDGTAWVLHGTIVTSTTRYYNETAFIQTTDADHYIAIMRSDTNGDSGDMWRSDSSDGGKTWSTPVLFGLTGTLNPGVYGGQAISPTLYRSTVNGHIAAVYGVRYPTPGYWGAAVVISTDDGKSFLDRSPALPLAYTSVGAAATYNFGYPSICQNPDGTFVITAYHESNFTIGKVNIARVICDEDWICNSPNVYLNCEAFTTDWASRGANVTISTDRCHSGTRSMKVDNSAGNGVGSIIKLWSRISAAQAARKIAYSYWVYCSRMAAGMGHGGSVVDVSGKMRTSVNVLAVDRHLKWYDGKAYQDTGLSVNDGAWHKVSVRAETTPTTVKGTVSVDGGVPASIGQRSAGGGAVALSLGAGTTGGPTPTTVYFDDIYSHQYADVPPNVSVALPGPPTCQS